MSCACGAGKIKPSSSIHEKLIFALNLSLFQSPASSVTISDSGNMFKISKLPPK